MQLKGVVFQKVRFLGYYLQASSSNLRVATVTLFVCKILSTLLCWAFTTFYSFCNFHIFFENLRLLRCGNHFIYHKVVPNGHLKLGLIPLILVYCWTLRVCYSGECSSKVLETRPFYDGELFLIDLIVEKTSYIKFM